jgi:hypothetical protein
VETAVLAHPPSPSLQSLPATLTIHVAFSNSLSSCVPSHAQHSATRRHARPNPRRRSPPQPRSPPAQIQEAQRRAGRAPDRACLASPYRLRSAAPEPAAPPPRAVRAIAAASPTLQSPSARTATAKEVPSPRAARGQVARVLNLHIFDHAQPFGHLLAAPTPASACASCPQRASRAGPQSSRHSARRSACTTASSTAPPTQIELISTPSISNSSPFVSTQTSSPLTAPPRESSLCHRFRIDRSPPDTVAPAAHSISPPTSR